MISGDTPANEYDKLIDVIKSSQEKFPASTRVQRISMPQSTYDHLKSKISWEQNMLTSAKSLSQVLGLPVYMDESIAPNCYVVHYADGHTVLVTPQGKPN